MLKRVTILSLLIVLAVGLNAHAGYYLSAGPRANSLFAATGKIDRIDYRYEDFDLATDSETYSILADHSNIRLQTGRPGTIRDLKNGSYVRIEGERLSDGTARANTVVILDSDGGQALVLQAKDTVDSRSERADIHGTVSRVYTRDNELILRGSQNDYVVVIRPETLIRQYIYRATISDILEGDELSVAGTLTGHYKLYADRIQITKRDRTRTVAYRDREDLVEGVITYPPASFDRTFAVQTDRGERKVDVRRNATLGKDGREIGVHDLRRDDKVRAFGVWDGNTLNATRVDVVDQFAQVEPVPAIAPVLPDAVTPPTPPAPAPTEDNPPAAAPRLEETHPAEQNPPAETAPAEPPARTNVHVGRIVAIDYDKFELTIDVSMQDVQVVAQDSPVTRKGSTRRFSDLKKGDMVTVTGDIAGGVVKATSIEVGD